MHDLTAITALGGQSPRVDTIGEVMLRENDGLALASVHARLGHETACREHLANLLDRRVPEIGKVVLRDPEAAFWTGPDQWMVGAPYSTHEDLAAQLKARFGASASITEQSDAWACFDLKGAKMEAVMELLCSINIRIFCLARAAHSGVINCAISSLRRRIIR